MYMNQKQGSQFQSLPMEVISFNLYKDYLTRARPYHVWCQGTETAVYGKKRFVLTIVPEQSVCDTDEQ